MLVDFSTQVNTDLTNYTALTALLDDGANSITALLGTQAAKKHVVYYISFDGLATKANAGDYKVIIQSWANSYEDSISIADKVFQALGESTYLYNYLSAVPKFYEEEFIYTEQIFTIKK